jgi:hypothetical protein
MVPPVRVVGESVVAVAVEVLVVVAVVEVA